MRAIGKISRNNFVQNLIDRMPVIISLFVIQSIIIRRFSPETNIYYFVSFMSLSISVFISLVILFDKHHNIYLYHDFIHISCKPIALDRSIYFHEIKSITAPNKEYRFSTITLDLEDNTKVDLHFVDYPVQTKNYIEKLIETNKDLKKAS